MVVLFAAIFIAIAVGDFKTGLNFVSDAIEEAKRTRCDRPNCTFQ